MVFSAQVIRRSKRRLSGHKMLALIVAGSLSVLFSVNLWAVPHATGTGKHTGIAADDWKQCSLLFVENKGQIIDQDFKAREDIQYQLTATGGVNVFISAGVIHYQFCKAEQESQQATARKNAPAFSVNGHEHNTPSSYTFYRMDVELEGANKSAIAVASGMQEYHENYYKSNMGVDGVRARSFNRITYRNIYPNIDWVLNTTTGSLKHEFVVHKGGKVSDIRLKYRGATDIQIQGDGSLVATTPQGSIAEQAPFCVQNDGVEVPSRFVIEGDAISYEIGSYSGDLVIDPGLSWATYYGGYGGDYSNSLVCDAAGNVYMAGCTTSLTSIATTGAHQQTMAGSGSSYDGFIIKLDGSGNRIWATYYGGSSTEHLNQIVMDHSGLIYVVGATYSSDGIATPGAHKDIMPSSGYSDGFLIKFNDDGVRIWGTYFGGVLHDMVNTIAVDASGDLYIGGDTDDTVSISSPGSHQVASGGLTDGFLAKFSNAGAKLWATYYGGNSWDYISSIAIGTDNNVYVGGGTLSPNAISTAGAHQDSFGGAGTTQGDCFLAKFSSTGVRDWATYYGGTGEDYYSYLVTDAAGNIFLAGNTNSTTGIATAGSHKSTLSPNDGFLVKFNNAGNRQWGTYVGGVLGEKLSAIACDGNNNIFVGGFTSTHIGFATPDAYQVTKSGTNDGFWCYFDSNGVLKYCTYLGGPDAEEVRAIACDGFGNVYVAGETNSKTGIASAGGFDTSYSSLTAGGVKDAFLAKFNGIPVSVKEPGTSQSAMLSLYPNPSHGTVTVRYPNPATLRLISVDGRLIKEYIIDGETTIVLPDDLSQGIYLCQVYGKDGTTATSRLVYLKE